MEWPFFVTIKRSTVGAITPRSQEAKGFKISIQPPFASLVLV